MKLTDQLRDLLARAAAPLNIDQIMEQIPTANRDSVWALLSQRKKAGEFVSCVEDGRACYAIAAGYRASPKAAPKRFDKATEVEASATPQPSVPAVTDAHAIEASTKAASRPYARRTASTPARSHVETLRHALSAAEAARDAYIDSLVNPRFYGFLQESVRAAREALAAFERGAA
jgi:hypothetical protein